MGGADGEGQVHASVDYGWQQRRVKGDADEGVAARAEQRQYEAAAGAEGDENAGDEDARRRATLHLIRPIFVPPVAGIGAPEAEANEEADG